MTDGTTHVHRPLTGTASGTGLFELQFRALDLLPLKLKAGRFTLGSDPDCDLVVPVPGVEPQHCLLLVGPRKVVVKALAAKTWIDDGAIRESALTIGQRLIIGPVEMRLAQATAEVPPHHHVDAKEGPFAPQDIDEAITSLKQSTASEPKIASLDSIESFLNEYFERHRPNAPTPAEPAVDIQQLVDRQLVQPREELQARQDALAEQERALKFRDQELEQERVRLELRQFALNEQQQDVTDRAAAMASDRVAVRRERELLENRRTELLKQEEAFQQQLHDLRAERLDIEQARTQLQRDRQQFEQQAEQLEHREQDLAHRLTEIESREQELSHSREELHQLRATLSEQQAEQQQRELEWQGRQEQLAIHQAKLATSSEDLESLKLALAEREQSLNARDEELQARDQSLQQQATELQQQTAQFEQTRSAWQTESTDQATTREQHLQQEQERLQAWADELQARADAESMVDPNGSQVEQLQAELQTTTAQLAETREEFVAQIQKLQSELSARSTELEELRQTGTPSITVDQETSSQVNSDSDQRYSELEQRIQELEQEREQLMQQLSDHNNISASYESLQSRHAELEEQLRQEDEQRQIDIAERDHLQQQLEAAERQIEEVAQNHESLKLEQQHLTAANEDLHRQLQELESQANHQQPTAELIECHEDQQRSLFTEPDDESIPAGQQSLFNLRVADEEPAEHQDVSDEEPQVVTTELEAAVAEPEMDEAPSDEANAAQDDEESASPPYATRTESNAAADPAIRGLRSQLAEMFGLPEKETRHFPTESDDSESDVEEERERAPHGPSEQRFDSIMAATRTPRTQHPESPPQPEPKAQHSVETRNDANASQTAAEDQGDDSVAAYMEQLLARMRRGNSSSESTSSSAQSTASSTPTPQVETAAVPDPEPVPQHDEIDSVEVERPTARTLNPEEKEAMRANLDSFRQLANSSARTAVATSQSLRMRSRVRMSLYLSMATWAVSALLLSAEHWSDQSQQLPGLMLMLIAAGISLWTLLSWLRVKQTEQTLPAGQLNSNEPESES